MSAGNHDEIRLDAPAIDAPYRAMFESFIDPVVTADLERRIVYVNPAFERAFGFTAAEVHGRPTGFVYARPEQFEAYGHVIRDHVGQGAYRSHNTYRTKAGGTFVGETTLSYLKDADGRVTGFVGMIRDVTDQISLQRRFERQHDLTERLIRNIPAGICYMDRELVHRWTNPKFLEMLDVPGERLQDRQLREAFPEAADQIEPLFRHVLETGEPFHGDAFPFDYETHGLRRRTYWDVTVQPVLDADGQVEGILVLAVEVSERVERDQARQERVAALQATDRMKDEFLSVLSHELRTPLNFIQGFASILDDELAGALNDAQRGYVRRILEGSDLMVALVTDLLDMSRLHAGKFLVEAAPTDVRAAVAAAVAALVAQGGLGACPVSDEVPEGLPPVLADPEMVARVVRNLIGNAVKHAGPCAVTLRARAEDGCVRVEVIDRGPGVPEAARERIFEPFTQLDMSKTRQAGGVGLGLAISKGLVEAHGGSIGVEGPAAGEAGGATFWFTLPVAPEPTALGTSA